MKYMKKALVVSGLGLLAAMNTSTVSAQQIFFTGFEGGIDNTWDQDEPVANSGVAFQGSGSAQVNSGGSLTRRINVDQNTNYRITAYVRGGGRLRARWDGQNLSTRVTNPSNNFIERSIEINSAGASSIDVSLEFNSQEGRFDNVSVVRLGGGSNDSSSSSGDSGEVFTMQKRNTNFSIDGAGGAQVGLNIYLWNTNPNNVNQQWVDIDRGNGFVSYRKQNTNVCIDGGNGGERGQAVINFTCNANNQNQQWRKISQAAGHIRLQKRNASGFSIDGQGGAERLQRLHLWTNNNNNKRITTTITPMNLV